MQAGLAARIQGWARFRNVLVHLYLDIDHKRTHAVIQTKLVERVPGLGKRPAALTQVPRLDLLRIVDNLLNGAASIPEVVQRAAL